MMGLTSSSFLATIPDSARRTYVESSSRDRGSEKSNEGKSDVRGDETRSCCTLITLRT